MDAQGPKLLLVDDDPFALELQVRLARQAIDGCMVEAVSDPVQVAAACARTAFDCVVLDYDMPVVDGMTLATELRTQHPYLPIILCTGAGDELLAAKALQGGLTDYIPKSAISTTAFRRTVLHAIEIAANSRLIDEQRRELEGFAFALAHDFKQPLRQITTFADLATQDMEDEQPEEARRHLAFLRNSARRLSALVDVMSQYTLLNKPIEPELIRVGSVVEGAQESLSAYIEERRGVVRVVGDSFVLGSGVFLHQIMHNLIVNGFKYNGSVVPKVDINISNEGDVCRISVRDNGIGIGQAYLEQVFKPLARLHTSAEYSGTGLGLTMARKAAAAQGGAITCRSKLGVGSEFIVTLPLAVSASAV